MKEKYDECMTKIIWKLGNIKNIKELNSLIYESKEFFGGLSPSQKKLFYGIWVEAVKTKIARLIAEMIQMMTSCSIAKYVKEKVDAFVTLGDTIATPEENSLKENSSINNLETINHLLSYCNVAINTNEAGVMKRILDLLDYYDSILDASSMNLVRRHLLSGLQKFVLEQGEQLDLNHDEIGYWNDFMLLLEEDMLSDQKDFLSNYSFDREELK